MLHGRWTEENRKTLEWLIDRESKEPPIAVFDWDNTCIRGDISDVVFRHLCADLAFRFEEAGFWDWVTEARYQNEVSEAYAKYRASPSPENRMWLSSGMEATRKALHEGMDDTSAWAWDSGAFIGWTEAEVRQYTSLIIRRELERAPKFGSDKTTAGLVLRTEMKDLIAALTAAGWQVWILSASPFLEVQVCAGFYDVPPDHVVGMRRQVVSDKISLEVIPPVSFSDGKLDAYRLFINGSKSPSFVAGDSLGDWKLLESSDCLRLLVEPVPSHLRKFAEWRRAEGELWLFQQFD